MDQNTSQPKQQVVDRLKQANNVLVTVSKDPSVDQLAACIGLSLALNKLGKHATAVYSGETPSTIEFLKPEETIEKNTDSLRDFIISLDKSKADKLRYKVEDQVVRIFITPYKTSITDKDLEFSQGDFNVDVVLAIGVHAQEDLDQAITAHGRILHDAAVVTVNTVAGGELGSINWVESGASSLAEMASSIATELGKDLLDEQIATALLTGIVAETERFSNEKTSAETMNVSATLMSAGANQQLVANQLEPVAPEPPQPIEQVAPAENVTEPEVPAENTEAESEGNGTLQIEHVEDEGTDKQDVPAPEPEAPTEPVTPLASEPEVEKVEPLGPPPAEEVQAPTVEYDDPAASQPKVALHNESYQNPRQAIQAPSATPAFTSAATPAAPEPKVAPSVDLPPVAAQPHDDTDERETLQDIEKKVHSPHLEVPLPPAEDPALPAVPEAHAPEELDLTKLQRPEGIDDDEGEKPDVDAARQAVEQAMAAAPTQPTPEPIAALNAQPLGDPIRDSGHETTTAPTMPDFNPALETTPEATMTMPLPPTMPTTPFEPQENSDEPKAPSVPPPILPPPFGQN